MNGVCLKVNFPDNFENVYDQDQWELASRIS